MDGTALELFLLALAAALWPLLLAVVVVALRLPHPVRILSAFLAGALLTTIVLGLVIVRALQDSRITTSSRATRSAAFDFTVAALLLLTAFILRRRDRRAAPKAPAGPSWSERALGRGAALAFVAGIVLDIVPGFVPFVAMNEIAQLHYGFAASLGLVTAFYLVMFVLVEAPLVGYLVSPERTAVLATRFNEWLGRNFVRIAIGAADVTAAYLIVRGAVKLIRG